MRFIIFILLAINLHCNQSMLLDEKAGSCLKPLLVYLAHQKPIVSQSLIECCTVLESSENKLSLELVIRALPEILEQITALRVRFALLLQAGLTGELELLQTATNYVQKVNDVLKEAQQIVNDADAQEIQALNLRLESFIGNVRGSIVEFEMLQAMQSEMDLKLLKQKAISIEQSIDLLASKMDSMTKQISDMQKAISSIH